MGFCKRGSLALPIVSFIFLGSLFFYASILEAKTNTKDPAVNAIASKKKSAVIDGFRSAKFGMDEKKITRAISKDFKISRSKIKRSTHPIEKTLSLNIDVPNLLATGGTARISYILGHKSKKLMHVNVFWGPGPNKNVDGQSIVDTANLLRDYLNKKKYKDNSVVTNAKISETQIMAFRGTDQKGRMTVLTLTTPKASKDESPKDVSKKVSLLLSYILKPNNPDILTIEEGLF
jgi:hypothetical protein